MSDNNGPMCSALSANAQASARQGADHAQQLGRIRTVLHARGDEAPDDSSVTIDQEVRRYRDVAAIGRAAGVQHAKCADDAPLAVAEDRERQLMPLDDLGGAVRRVGGEGQQPSAARLQRFIDGSETSEFSLADRSPETTIEDQQDGAVATCVLERDDSARFVGQLEFRRDLQRRRGLGR